MPIPPHCSENEKNKKINILIFNTHVISVYTESVLLYLLLHWFLETNGNI